MGGKPRFTVGKHPQTPDFDVRPVGRPRASFSKRWRIVAGMSVGEHCFIPTGDAVPTEELPLSRSVLRDAVTRIAKSTGREFSVQRTDQDPRVFRVRRTK